jgi:glucosylceramidase
MEEKLMEGDGGEMQQVCVHPSISYQQILGMGGALTEAAAYTYARMSAEKQQQLLALFFGDGNHYNFCRLHIQSCDFALGNYAYVEDAKDTGLDSFSIERDRKYIIPFAKAALEKKSKIQFLASPWSPPAFMKTNGEMNHGGKLKKEYYQMWADMVARYVSAYRDEGITIQQLTVQNEPAAVQTWDSCIFSGVEEAEFACRYLRPALDRAQHSDVKINVWDHNKEKILERAAESFSVEGARDVIDGIAFHWYTGEHFDALAEVHRQYPDKALIFTEGCVEYSRFEAENQIQNAEMYAHDIIGDFNAGMNGFIDWNLILDRQGGSNHVGNYCDAPVMCDVDADTIDVKLSYSYIGHFSRFIRPGARRILVSKYSPDIETTAFQNEDGGKVLVILNRSEKEVEFVVSVEGKRSGKMKIGKHSIMTCCWA